MVSVSGIVSTVRGIYLTFGYLDPWGWTGRGTGAGSFDTAYHEQRVFSSSLPPNTGSRCVRQHAHCSNGSSWSGAHRTHKADVDSPRPKASTNLKDQINRTIYQSFAIMAQYGIWTINTLSGH